MQFQKKDINFASANKKNTNTMIRTMAHTIFRTIAYKGSSIEQVETFNQRFFVINGNYAEAVWSISDAKRIINGLQPNSFPVSICKEDLI